MKAWVLPLVTLLSLPALAEGPVKTLETKVAVSLAWAEARSTPAGWRYRVELRVRNTSPKPVKLDGPSVAERGELSNDLFRVTCDGQPVAYEGMLAKRAPPSRFLTLKPGAQHVVTVELGDAYPIPPGRHDVTVAFSHQNHFSPDDFRLESTPIARVLE